MLLLHLRNEAGNKPKSKATGKAAPRPQWKLRTDAKSLVPQFPTTKKKVLTFLGSSSLIEKPSTKKLGLLIAEGLRFFKNTLRSGVGRLVVGHTFGDFPKRPWCCCFDTLHPRKKHVNLSTTLSFPKRGGCKK